MSRKWSISKRYWLVRAVPLVAAASIVCLLVFNAVTYGSVWPQGCGNLPMGAIIADTRGRLGNNLAEYATIYAYGKRYQMPAVATTDLMRMMGHIFPFTSLPWVLESCTSGFQKVTADQFEAVNEHDRRKYRWKIIHYPHRIRLFWWYRDALMKEFRFRPDLVEYANSKLASVAGGRQVTFVAVHVRRTDYAKHLKGSNGHLVGAPFYHSAINLCRQRYSEPVFIVTSDDLKWCRENLSGTDIYLLGDPRSEFPGVERDLALLAACNHTIFDYGTYGFFAAFLAGGDMILAEGYSEREHEIIEELREGNITATYIDGNGTVLPKCARCR